MIDVAHWFRITVRVETSQVCTVVNVVRKCLQPLCPRSSKRNGDIKKRL